MNNKMKEIVGNVKAVMIAAAMVLCAFGALAATATGYGRGARINGTYGSYFSYTMPSEPLGTLSFVWDKTGSSAAVRFFCKFYKTSSPTVCSCSDSEYVTDKNVGNTGGNITDSTCSTSGNNLLGSFPISNVSSSFPSGYYIWVEIWACDTTKTIENCNVCICLGYFNNGTLINYAPGDEPVARIGEYYYKTLDAACTAATAGDTVTLLCDASFSANIAVNAENVTLDFGTNKVTRTSNSCAINFNKSGTVLGGVVDNSSYQQGGSTLFGAMAAGVTVTFSNTVIGANIHSAFYTYTSTSKISLYNVDCASPTFVSSSSSGTVTIDGGDYTSTSWHYSTSYQTTKTTINSGKFYLDPSAQTGVTIADGSTLVTNSTDTVTPYHVGKVTGSGTAEDPWVVSGDFEEGDLALAGVDAVASIGHKYYASVAEAVAAAHEGETADSPTTIKLLLDTTENVTIPDGRYITLDLNDRVLKGDGTTSVIYNSGTLTLADSAEPKTARYWDKDSDSGLWTLAEDQTTATDYVTTGGCITCGIGRNNDGWRFGGGVYNEGSFTLSGGTIVGNNCEPCGGGVYNEGTFEMTGGEIVGNNAVQVGGGVHNDGTFTMTGGAISENKASNCGGGVYNEGTFEMMEGVIAGNTVRNGGGGVYNDYGTFTMSGGEIAGNTAEYDGGGVYNYEGTITMSGGEISGNTANSYGGGVYNDEGTFTMNGGCITDNSCVSYGGGVYNYGTFNMQAGEISGNIATDGEDGYGGGVINFSTFTMTGGEIADNAAICGGGIANNGNLLLENCSVTNNTIT